jgi:hypothetical protein
MSQVIKITEAPKRLRLKKMQIAGYKSAAAKDGKVLVGFYKKDGQIHPITRSIHEMNHKKVVKHGKHFRGINPKSKARHSEKTPSISRKCVGGGAIVESPDQRHAIWMAILRSKRCPNCQGRMLEISMPDAICSQCSKRYTLAIQTGGWFGAVHSKLISRK